MCASLHYTGTGQLSGQPKPSLGLKSLQNNRGRHITSRPLLRCKPGHVREPIHLSQAPALDPPKDRPLLVPSRAWQLGSRPTPASSPLRPETAPPTSSPRPALGSVPRSAFPAFPGALYGLDRYGVGGVPKCEDPSCSTCTLPRRPSPSSLPLLPLVRTHH